MSERIDLATRVANARTFLFVPADRPDRFASALNSPADAIVLDLEDSVPPERKMLGRDAIIREWAKVCRHSKVAVIRINSPQSGFGIDDLRWLANLDPYPVIMVSKAESAAAIGHVRKVFSDAPQLPLIESAEGLARLPEIAAEVNVVRLVVGHIDFMVDTGIQCSVDQRELDSLRFSVSLQTRLRSLASPVDGVTVDVNNEVLLHNDTMRAVNFGFGAKLCIHPRQVAAVHAALAPSSTDVLWARRVIEESLASGGSAFKLDGRMVDAPVVLQAKRILARQQVSEA